MRNISKLTEKHVSRETYDDLCAYHDLVLKWTKVINLVSANDRQHIWERHIYDSIQVAAFVNETTSIIDLGSGAGFPSIPISIIHRSQEIRPKITLVESDSRKCAFLREVKRKLNLDIVIINSRIEDIPIQTHDIVTARALASLNQLFEWVEKISHTGTKMIFPKGKSWEQEVKDASQNWKFDHTAHKSETNNDAVILEIANLKRNR